MDQIVVGMADCRVGDAPGRGAGNLCPGFLHRAGGVRSGGVGRGAAAFHAAGFHYRSRARDARTPTCSPTPESRCCSSRYADAGHPSGVWSPTPWEALK